MEPVGQSPPGSDATSQEVVEVIPPDGGAAPPPAPPASGPAAPPASRLDWRAWARGVLEVGLRRTGAVASDLDVPHDRLVGRGQLYLRVRAAPAPAFETVVGGLLAYQVRERDPDTAETFDGFNGQATRTDFDATLYEAYLGFFSRRLDLRVGQQRLVWGRGDAFAPNDVQNGRDTRDPILGETDVLHLPTPMVRLDADVAIGTLQLVWQPWFRPDRFDTYGANWARVQPDTPPWQRQLLAAAFRVFDPTLEPLVQPLHGASERPPADLTGSSGGARFGLARSGVDVDVFYDYGYDRMPFLTVDPRVVSAPDPATLAVGLMAAGERPLRARYLRRHHAGTALQTTVRSLALRAEVAYDSTVVLTRAADLTGVEHPAVQATAAVEYQTGELGKTVLLEGWYQHLVGAAGGDPLLGVEPDSAAVALLGRWTFIDRLEVELRAAVGVAPRSYLLRPQIGWKFNALAVYLGAVLLGGEEGSMAHYFRRNQSLYLLAKYSL